MAVGRGVAAVRSIQLLSRDYIAIRLKQQAPEHTMFAVGSATKRAPHRPIECVVRNFYPQDIHHILWISHGRWEAATFAASSPALLHFCRAMLHRLISRMANGELDAFTATAALATRMHSESKTAAPNADERVCGVPPFVNEEVN